MRKLLTCWLLITASLLVQADTQESYFAAPELLKGHPLKVQLIESLVLLSSPHSPWIYAFTPGGRPLWKRRLEWPIGEVVRVDQGILLAYGPDARAEGIRLDTGERILRQSRQRRAWLTPRVLDPSRPEWLALTPEGRLQSWDPQWNTTREIGRLSLSRQDSWWGPPVELPWGVFAGSFRGQLQQWTPEKIYVRTQIDHPLVPLMAHPRGVVQVSQDGQLLFQGKNRYWQASFAGQNHCYNLQGDPISRPCWDEEGNLYLSHGRGLVSWTADGVLRWQLTLNCSTAAACAQGQVVVAEGERSLLFLDAKSGKLLRRHSLPAGAEAQIGLDSRRLVVGLDDHRVLVLDHWTAP